MEYGNTTRDHDSPRATSTADLSRRETHGPFCLSLSDLRRSGYNAVVNRAPPEPPRRPLGLSPVALGTACCILSALGYTAANVCLRRLTQLATDEMWATAVKEVVTVATIGPWLAWQAWRGRQAMPPWRWLLLLAAVGATTQLLGNLPLMWAFRVVGLAISMPAVFACMLTGSALMGWILLGEGVPTRSVVAIALLLVAIVVLRFGAVRAGALVPGTPSPALMVLGVAAAGLAGTVFALLTISIRVTGARGVPVSVIMLIVTGMGVACLGLLSLVRLGPAGLAATTPEQLAYMLGAGVFNFLAFLAITTGLQLTTVVHANVLNAGQVAMGAIAGIVLFRESWNAWIALGIGLTIAGLMLVSGPQRDEQEVPGA